MESTNTRLTQANNEHVLHGHINQFLTDSARYLGVEMDSINLETLSLPGKSNLDEIRNK